ncbi:MAG: lysylphosphatidylglycerol synthase transmembrane domain-containing protein [Gemmatimonadaceae bacterium]
MQPGPFAELGELAPKRRRTTLARRLVLALAIAAVAAGLVVFARGLDANALVSAFRHVRLLPIIIAAALSFVQLGFKALGWREILAPIVQLSPARAYRYTAGGAAMSLVMPARAGEALRVWLLKRDYEVPIASSSSVAIAEKLIDGVAMLVVLAPLPWMLPELPHWIGRAIGGFSLVLGTALIVLWFFAPVATIGEKWWHGLQAGLGFLRQPRHIGRALAAMIGGWLTDWLSVTLVLYAVGVSVPAAAGLLILLTINLAIAIPAMPGHLGTMELGALVALELLHVPRAQGLSFALLYHAIQVVPLLLVSIVSNRFLLAPPGGGGTALSVKAVANEELR